MKKNIRIKGLENQSISGTAITLYILAAICVFGGLILVEDLGVLGVVTGVVSAIFVFATGRIIEYLNQIANQEYRITYEEENVSTVKSDVNEEDDELPPL